MKYLVQYCGRGDNSGHISDALSDPIEATDEQDAIEKAHKLIGTDRDLSLYLEVEPA